MRLLGVLGLLLQCGSNSDALGTCTVQGRKITHRFHLLRHCQRSDRNIVGLASTRTVRECADLARTTQGLAFNYAPTGRNGSNWYDVVNEVTGNNSTPAPWKTTTTTSSPFADLYNCQVLDCPEYRNLSTIVNDTRFDYYTLYGRVLPSTNATCVPSIGVFLFEDTKLNYSRAYNACQTFGGSLAHVASDMRTFHLSRIISDVARGNESSATEYYVGLNESIYDRFYTSADERLECFTFRAWAPGHPARNRVPGCVALTGEGSWKVFNCNRPLPYICELHTSGPAMFKPNVRRKCSVKRPNNRLGATRKRINT
ncbi:uncharacterized protein LOC131207983 [Anopheles bellator]|uniref:uncharacterized protein LOC131207983 n=1 Tax=Anopheles bellator TaxID=139047 RepID=UPI002648114D|nr:uncharacterized protein LOC131207983 [Anopheles bellator]